MTDAGEESNCVHTIAFHLEFTQEELRMVFRVKRLAHLALAVLLVASACGPATSPTAAPLQELTLATTTSTADSGLLDAILPVFEQANGIKVNVIAVGTGQALKLGEDGNADVVLVHARAREDQFVADGWGIARHDVMYNDFILVGPAQDPAGIKETALATDALKAIAGRSATFASRGDESGTHTKEKDLWQKAGIAPQGDWYKSLGQGMGDTLVFANETGAYTLADRGTYLAMQDKLPNLAILVGGTSIAENQDKSLLNPYGVIAVNPAKHPHVKRDLAEKLIAWITSAETQALIGDYGVDKYGQPLFYPNAAAAQSTGSSR
jgi:tungstate transport system substrate-binding protein